MTDQLLNTPSRHGFSVSGLIDATWHRVSETALTTTKAWTWRIAQAAALSFLKKITVGQLRVITSDGTVYVFPEHLAPSSKDSSPLTSPYPGEHDSGSSSPTPFGSSTSTTLESECPTRSASPRLGSKHAPLAEFRVLNDAFWIRLCLMSDLGFAEAYMYGEVECKNLVALFELFLANKEYLSSNLDTRLSYLFTTLPQKITSYRFLNTLGNAQSNISAHYDISNDMFAGFLSPDMTYSCGIFEDLDGDLVHGRVSSKVSSLSRELATHLKHFVHPDDISKGPKSSPRPDEHASHDALHASQLRKLDHVIEKAHILPGQRILEIGSGWGSMAIRIAQTVPSIGKIDTLTLSLQQQTLARERIRAVGLEGKIEVHLMDYRAMPKNWEGVFDRVISIEMIEAVGKEFLEAYWKTVDWALKKENAVGVVQVITLPEARLDKYMAELDFIRKWVFPGGFLPTLTMLIQTLCAGSQGRLVVDSVSNIGPHYSRTLREWRSRFEDRFEEVIVPALEQEYPEVMRGENGRKEVEVFKRKWIYYYCYCEIGFTTRTLGDHIITFSREGYQDYGCNVYA
ncbi:cyclopropane-fatty-acyl-phospholipid synthase [Pluteus cervinus]|uniref:Cyclopropane-fatty-acyl-phospholipid synthase n=1 Tax=Pluteus cervinus TaxID=181527 RepID=A0ACD3AU81_9AGAR|nr:cyclopropane-fatty-acyl-phospholipid synthase [Pluteus cervinus]